LHPVRVGHAVTAQPLAEILRFADVKNHLTRIAHEINAGALRQLSEEIASQPLDKRLRIGNEKLLNRRHSGDSTRKPGTSKVQDFANWFIRVDVLEYARRGSFELAVHIS
jgi:hypothetical protein